MLKFNRDKEKKLNFKIDLEGIDKSVLEYYIRLSSGNTDYGFKGFENNGILEFTIPALSGIIKESEIDKLKSIKIEVHDNNNKYYLRPLDESIEFELAPKVDVKVDLEEDKDFKIKLKKVSEEDKKVDKKDTKNTKISKFLK